MNLTHSLSRTGFTRSGEWQAPRGLTGRMAARGRLVPEGRDRQPAAPYACFSQPTSSLSSAFASSTRTR